MKTETEASVVESDGLPTIEPPNRPKLKLVGTDGNAFALLGAAQRVARKNGWSKEQISAVLKVATSGDYDHLLQTLMRYFDVC